MGMKKTHGVGENILIGFLRFYVKLAQICGMIKQQHTDKEAAYGSKNFIGYFAGNRDMMRAEY